MVVEKGDKIYVPADQLTSQKITVHWQQSLTQHQQDYYSVPFFNKDKGDEQSVLFISTNYLEAFKKKKVSSGSGGMFSWLFFWSSGEGDYHIIVDDSFQYGQNQDHTSRWLAFHDKSITAFQWRFVASLQSTLGSGLVKYGGAIFKQYYGVDVSALSGLIGDPLHNF